MGGGSGENFVCHSLALGLCFSRDSAAESLSRLFLVFMKVEFQGAGDEGNSGRRGSTDRGETVSFSWRRKMIFAVKGGLFLFLMFSISRSTLFNTMLVEKCPFAETACHTGKSALHNSMQSV